MSRDPEHYKLPAELHEQIFQEDILPELARGRLAVAQPRAVILGGQPGAGKSALQSVVEQEMAAEGGVLSIVGDDLRAYHPEYRRLQLADDKMAAFYTDRDSAQWIEKLISYARVARLNVLIESTMRVPEKICDTAREFRASGYFVEARAIAVHARWSTLGIHQRYEAMLTVQGRARFTLQKSHDAAYAGMLDTITQLEDEALVDRLVIYRRGNIVLYDNVRSDAGWLRGPGARAAVEAERARPWSAQEQIVCARAWERVVQQRRVRGARPEDLAQARAERALAILEIHADPAAKDALAAQLDAAALRRVERHAAAAAFRLWPRQRAAGLFPALAAYFDALERSGSTAQAKGELGQQCEQLYPKAPGRAPSRRPPPGRDPGRDR